MLNLQTIYDDFADLYEENRGQFNIDEVLAAFHAELSEQPGKLLDLGCGAGEPVGSFFLKKGWTVVGIDFSTRMLKLAARYAPKMILMPRDMRDLDCFYPGQFDAITAVYSLFHLPIPDQLRVFARIFALLRPGGAAMFTYASREYTGQDEFAGVKEFMGRELYYAHLPLEALLTRLSGLGFALPAVVHREIGGEVFPWVTVRKPGLLAGRPAAP